MMFQREILEYLRGRILAMKDTRLPSPPVVLMPNEPLNETARNSSVYFEVYTSGSKPIFDTENSAVSTMTCSIVVNGTTDTGISFVDAISDALMYQFAPYNACRQKGFTSYADSYTRKTLVYVDSVERSETGIFNNRYKSTIFVTLQIYEGTRSW